ncbi:MAG TPA: hypothetical protein VM124_03005 [Candidatus Limnocylindrales bacterium]|nr:hypothetical protein [Candidatus Limnocylindrales bacterium]
MMKKTLVFFALLAGLLIGGLSIPRQAEAAVAAGCNNSSSVLGLPTWYKYLDIGPKRGDKCAIIGPVDSHGKLDWALAGGRIGLAIVDILLRLAAIVAVGFVIFGGFRYILSQGEPDNTRKARGTVLAAVIGLVITILATAAVNFVGNTLIK